ncbi:S-adenosyl-L-methionine-dependent methyltransferase [Aspergillus heterothallicus]
MSAQYDTIGSKYSAVKQLLGAELQLAAIKTHIGDVTDLKVLDLACGNGYYSRKLVEWGATRVLALDISQAMIDDAWSQTSSQQAERVEFRVADCAGYPLDLCGEKFDLVLCAWSA